MKKAFIWVSDFVSLTKKNILMARNFFWFLTENNYVRGTGNTNNIPDMNWLRQMLSSIQLYKMTSLYKVYATVA